jgi:hypothetical protein
MIWSGSSVREWLLALVIITTVGIVTSAILRSLGWSWWARIIVIIPIVAVMARIAGRILSNTTVIFLH